MLSDRDIAIGFADFTTMRAFDDHTRLLLLLVFSLTCTILHSPPSRNPSPPHNVTKQPIQKYCDRDQDADNNILAQSRPYQKRGYQRYRDNHERIHGPCHSKAEMKQMMDPTKSAASRTFQSRQRKKRTLRHPFNFCWIEVEKKCTSHDTSKHNRWYCETRELWRMIDQDWLGLDSIVSALFLTMLLGPFLSF